MDRRAAAGGRRDAGRRREWVARYNEAAGRTALQNYVNEAGQVAAQINGQGAQARDLRARFLGFQADARAALGDVSRPAALKADFTRVATDCESCHNLYQD